MQAHGLADDEDLLPKRLELDVEVRSLKAMELRHVQQMAQALATRKESNYLDQGDNYVAKLMLQIRASQIREKLGALQQAAFGNYAVPAPDGERLDNEMPTADYAGLTNDALAITRDALTVMGATTLGMDAKDQLAGAALGLNPANSEQQPQSPKAD